MEPDISRVYDFIVCGAGASGAVVASELAQNTEADVLLIEAGGDDRVPQVTDSRIWMQNIGSRRDWQFQSEPCPALNHRTPPLPMGKVLGGGSSINGLIWARGHRNDFDTWAKVSGDDGWSYPSVLDVYRRIERWDGPPDERRGDSGRFYVTRPQDPNPVARALTEAADAMGISAVDDLNAQAMEMPQASGLTNIPVSDGNRRVSVSTAWLRPAMTRPNLTVLTDTQVEKVVLEGNRAVGVRARRGNQTFLFRSQGEVILSMGAIHTPKVMMLSGIGDEQHLHEHGIETRVHLPGVGRNFQDHILVAGCCWEYHEPQAPRNNSAEFTFFAKSNPDLATPDLQPVLEECAFGSEITRQQYRLPDDPSLAWTLAPGLVRPHSRGRVLLSGNRFSDPLRIEANFLSDERDVRALLTAIELCRELGHSPSLKPFVKRELMPGPLSGDDMLMFLRNAAGTYFHQTCTAKMGTDPLSVVDGELRVYGIDGLRIADGAIMPEITTGNTMAPCVMIGQRAADLIIRHHL